MSVKKEDRQEDKQKLRVFTMALDLMNYTIQITDNENVFLPKHQRFTSVIVNETIEIYRAIFMANNLRLQEYYEDRQNLQKAALTNCSYLLADILVAKKVFKLRQKRISYWTRQINILKKTIENWKDSDTKRYKNLIKDSKDKTEESK